MGLIGAKSKTQDAGSNVSILEERLKTPFLLSFAVFALIIFLMQAGLFAGFNWVLLKLLEHADRQTFWEFTSRRAVFTLQDGMDQVRWMYYVPRKWEPYFWKVSVGCLSAAAGLECLRRIRLKRYKKDRDEAAASR